MFSSESVSVSSESVAVSSESVYDAEFLNALYIYSFFCELFLNLGSILKQCEHIRITGVNFDTFVFYNLLDIVEKSRQTVRITDFFFANLRDFFPR